MTVHRFTQRIDPRLSDILEALDGSAIGVAFRDRVIQLASSAAFAEQIDHRRALRAHLWLLNRAAEDDLAITDAGYLRPADVKAFAEVLPTMRDWIFPVTREIHSQPVLYFREYLRHVGLLRKYKGTLRATRMAKAGIADPARLWEHLSTTLIPTASSFDVTAGVVILVHMGTSDGRIDVNAVARTMTELGWSHQGGDDVDQGDVYPIWNDLWAALGNVGDPAAPECRKDILDRRMSPAAVGLIRDALFTAVDDVDE